MTDSALAQMFVVAIVAAGFIAALAAGAAVLTLLRRRRMEKAEALPIVAHASALKRAATQAPAPPAQKPTPPAPVPRAEAAITPPAVDSAEPPALLIEPEAGPTQRERDIQRLIKHLKSDNSAN